MAVSKAFLALALLIISASAYSAAAEESRGGLRVQPALFELQRTAGFDPAESAGLFVGVQKFTQDDSLAEVPFAVDDAVDLAYLFALELKLIRPERVQLLLSGETRKAESGERLNALVAAGAQRFSPSLSTVYFRLHEQVKAAGAKGLLVVSFATHGYSVEGTHHLAAEDSVLAIRETAVVADRILDAVAQAATTRRLVFLDACRERLARTRGTGSAGADSAMSEQLSRAIGRATGQVVLSAARPGEYACEDFERRNGVFTAAVIDGLRCEAETDRRGFVTVGALAEYVQHSVTGWAERQRAGGVLCSGGIDVHSDMPAKELPLAFCWKCLPPESQPSHARVEGGVVEVFSEAGALLWVHKVNDTAVKAQVVDLNFDCKNEVVVGAASLGPDAGKVQALDYQGKDLWSVSAPREYIYQGSHGELMSVRALEVAELFPRDQGRTRQVVVLYHDALGWYPARLSILDADGSLLSTYFHPGHLHFLSIGASKAGEPPQIFVGGVSNDLRRFVPGEDNEHADVVFALDPRSIRGQRAEGPPYFGSIGEGNHSWFGVLQPKGVGISRLLLLDYNHDGINELCVWTEKAHVLYLDFSGRLVHAEGGEGVQGPIRFGLIRERSLKELTAPGGPKP
jgi:hypothetical protein